MNLIKRFKPVDYLKNYLFNASMKRKLIFFFLVIAILPILILGFSSFKISERIIIEKETKYVTSALNLAVSKIQQLTDDVSEISISLFYDKNLQQNLRNIGKVDDVEELKLYDYLYQYSNNIKMSKNYIQSIMLIDSGNRTYSNDYSLRNYISSNYLQTWYELMKEEKGNEIWFSPVKYQNKYIIPHGRLIRDVQSLEDIGAVIIYFNELKLYDQIKNINEGSKCLTAVINNDGLIISCTDRDIIGKSVFKIEELKGHFSLHKKQYGMKLVVIADKNNLLNSVEIGNIGWTVVNLLPYSEIVAKNITVKYITAIIAIFCFFLSILMALLISGKITSPVKKLQMLMKEIENGNFNINFKSKYNDEIGMLGQSFNNMVNQLKQMLKSIEDEQKMKRIAEFKALQAQLNPHFMYNTLDTIKWMADMGMVEQVGDITVSLAKFYRLSLGGDNEFTTVEEEIEHIRQYLNIQRYRYGDKLAVEYQIDESILNIKIPRLTLQPLIENSIYHGLKKAGRNGKITIKGLYKNKGINLYVIDNGIGMNKRELYFAKKKISGYQTSNNHPRSYGLKNVNDRLRLAFGSNCSFTILSRYDRGTIIKIKIRGAVKDDCAMEVLQNV